MQNAEMGIQNKSGEVFLRQIRSQQIDPATRKSMQQEIHQHILLNSPNVRDANFDVVSAADLGMLFQLNDEMFFGGSISRFVEQRFEKPLRFRVSTRMTIAGGTTTMIQSRTGKRQAEFEIAIASTPLFGTFRSESRAKVGGVVCTSRLEALQRIMEHEMIHLVELAGSGDSNCNARPFRNLVHQYFGHRESNHQLMTPTDVARKRLGIRCGDEVAFRIDGRLHVGYVNRITKRATVLVRDPRGVEYCDGQRYAKYYVPLAKLKRA